MSERRPHWDDELIEAVWDVAYATSDGCCLSAEGTHAVIAAVEDWHERKGEENLLLLMAEITKFLHRAEKAEAAIQRVRDLCAEFIRQDAEDLTYGSDTYTRAWVAHDILQALDGETPNKGLIS